MIHMMLISSVLLCGIKVYFTFLYYHAWIHISVTLFLCLNMRVDLIMASLELYNIYCACVNMRSYEGYLRDFWHFFIIIDNQFYLLQFSFILLSVLIFICFQEKKKKRFRCGGGIWHFPFFMIYNGLFIFTFIW